MGGDVFEDDRFATEFGNFARVIGDHPQRFARRRDGIEEMYGVPAIDREMYHSECREKIGKVIKAHSRIEFAEPRLYCDIPKACRTYKRRVFSCSYRTTDRLAECVELTPHDTNQHVSIKE